MSQPRSNHGESSENRIEEILKASYSEDFVVRNPKGLRENGLEEEIADFLVPFRDTLIVVQVKSREQGAPSESLDAVDLKRFEKRLQRGTKQLKTAKRALDNGWATEVETLRGITQPFSYGRFKKLVGIVVLDIPDEDEHGIDSALDLYGGLDEIQGITAHLFMRRDFGTLIEQLTTIPDLVEYLSVREELKKKEVLWPLSCEVDFLALFISQYGVIEQCLNGEITGLHLEDGLWESLTGKESAEFAERAESIRHSRFYFDRMVGAMHQIVGYEVPEWAKPATMQSGPGTKEQHLELVEELAGHRRVDRIRFSLKMEEKMRKADEAGFGFYVSVPGERACPLLFLSCAGDRKSRNQKLHTMVCALSVYFGGVRVMGIGTENLKSPVRSFDTYTVPAGTEFDNEEEIAEWAKQIFGNKSWESFDEWGNEYSPETS